MFFSRFQFYMDGYGIIRVYGHNVQSCDMIARCGRNSISILLATLSSFDVLFPYALSLLERAKLLYMHGIPHSV